MTHSPLLSNDQQLTTGLGRIYIYILLESGRSSGLTPTKYALKPRFGWCWCRDAKPERTTHWSLCPYTSIVVINMDNGVQTFTELLSRSSHVLYEADDSMSRACKVFVRMNTTVALPL